MSLASIGDGLDQLAVADPFEGALDILSCHDVLRLSRS